MSIAEQFRAMSTELDELVLRQDYPAAADRAACLAELVRRAERDHPAAELAALAAESMRIIEAARRKICVSRARMQECKQRLEWAAEYCFAPPAAEHTWSVEG